MALFHNPKHIRRRMLEEIGRSDVDDLFRSIPKEFFFNELPEMEGPLSELEVREKVSKLAERKNTVSFLGAGAYDHFIPSIVDHVVSRSEFYTAYTPYQPEISQGTLQAGYEFQSAVCALTGMDVANVSLYDGATALAEACMLAVRAGRKRNKILISSLVHPEYKDVVSTYFRDSGIDVEFLPQAEDGRTDYSILEKSCDDSTAGVVVQSPNFLGIIEDVKTVSSAAHSSGALSIQVTVEPYALVLLKTPAECNVDVFCGEGQGMGIPLSFGGPHLGLFACREKFLRQMPGRIVGKTVDADGRRAFCLTLSTREQHIRREKATSNICTNQALMALRMLVHVCAMGRSGLVSAARQSAVKAEAVARELCSISGVKQAYKAPFFNEFVLELPEDAEDIAKRAAGRGMLIGLPLGRFGWPKNHLLVCATEKHSKEQISELKDVMSEVLR